VQFNCVKKASRKTELNVSWHSTGFPSGLLDFFVDSVCLLLHVTMVDKNKELRKVCESLSELRSSLCERRMKRTVRWPALLSVKTAQFTKFFHQI
jgi:hypothetical protein